jgi:hypothetical protein
LFELIESWIRLRYALVTPVLRTEGLPPQRFKCRPEVKDESAVVETKRRIDVLSDFVADVIRGAREFQREVFDQVHMFLIVR